MALFSILIISLINSIISISQKNEYNSNTNCYKESNDFNPIISFIEIPDLSNKTEEDWKIFSINILTIIRDAPDILRDILTIIKDDIINNSRSDPLSFIVKDLFNNSNPILNDTIDLLKTKSGNESVLDCFIKILSEKILTNEFIILKLKEVLHFPRFRDLFNRIYERYKDFVFDIIALFPHKYHKMDTIVPVLLELKDFILKYKDILFELLCKITSHFNENKRIIEDLEDFVINNCTNTSFLDDMNLLLVNKTLVNLLSHLIRFDKEESNAIFKIVISNEQLMKFSIGFLKKKDLVVRFVNILFNLNNTKYINENVPNFMKDTIGDDIKVRKMIVKVFQNITRNIVTEQDLKGFMNKLLSGIFKRLIEEGHENFNISDKCFGLLTHTYFNPPTNDKFRFYYTKKLLIDSTKSKNDFLTYENCLNGYENSSYSTSYKNKYKIIPIYVVGKIIDRVNQSKLKNSIYYEKYNYMMSYCFPQGSNKTTGEYLCSNEDYGSLIKIFNSLSNNVFNATIKVFNITEDDIKDKSKPFTYFSLIVIISAIPLFIWIFLILYKNIKLSNPKEKEINNDLKSEKKNKNKIINKEYEIEKKEFSYIKIAPKWFRHLNEYFNLAKNGSELFNFTLNQTNFNDFNGITYIKGILGISMILNIFGLTFLIVANLLTKKLGSYELYI